MSDVTYPNAVAKTVGTMVSSLLIEAATALSALRAAKEAFDRGDVDHARLVVGNATVGRFGLDSLNGLIFDCLPTSGQEYAG